MKFFFVIAISLFCLATTASAQSNDAAKTAAQFYAEEAKKAAEAAMNPARQNKSSEAIKTDEINHALALQIIENKKVSERYQRGFALAVLDCYKKTLNVFETNAAVIALENIKIDLLAKQINYIDPLKSLLTTGNNADGLKNRIAKDLARSASLKTLQTALDLLDTEDGAPIGLQWVSASFNLAYNFKCEDNPDQTKYSQEELIRKEMQRIFKF